MSVMKTAYKVLAYLVAAEVAVHEFSLVGALHGLNALALFGVALHTGRRIRSRRALAAEQAHVATPV